MKLTANKIEHFRSPDLQSYSTIFMMIVCNML